MWQNVHLQRVPRWGLWVLALAQRCGARLLHGPDMGRTQTSQAVSYTPEVLIQTVGFTEFSMIAYLSLGAIFQASLYFLGLTPLYFDEEPP